MVKQFLLIIGFLFSIQVMSQTGIGTTTPNASAKLDVFSDNKGFLPPRVTLTSATDNTTISNAAEGLLVYNKGSVGLQAGYYYWNGANWATIATASSAGNGVTSMDMVKLYSKTYSNATADSTIANATGYKFTVPVSGRYLFDFSCTGYSNATITYKVRQGTNDLGTDAQTSYNNTVHVEYNGKIEVNLQSGVTYNVYVTSTGNRDLGDYDRVYYKLVAGNLPVTGQSVEYGIARYTGSDGSSLSANAIVAFDATAAGNLAWSGNKFTLKANKTYELESYLAVYHASAGVAGVFQIYNYTNSAVLASGLYISINGSGGYNVNGNGPMRCVITPSTDIEVGVRISSAYGGWPSIVGSTSTIGANGAPNQSYLLVKQIGSSAIINPWTLSGTSTSNTTGNVGIGTTTPGDLLVVGSSIALHDGGDKVVGLGWSPGSGKAILAGYPAEIRLNPNTGKLSLGIDPTSRSIGSAPGVQRRMTITSAGNTGIGTEDPTEKLEVIGNVKATNFIGTASSATLYLLEANSNASYSLSGPWINDICRYNNVNNTVNVPSSWFNTSNYRFTPQKAGYWEIIANYDVYRNAESYLFLQKNGSTVAQTGAFNLISAMVNKIVYLNGSSDYITVVNQGGAAYARNQNTSTSWFQARWVGE